MERASPWIAVVSYPKSGNTWMRMALGAVVNGGRLEAFEAGQEETVMPANAGAFLASVGVHPALLTRGEIGRVMPPYLASAARLAARRRVIKMHENRLTCDGTPLLAPGAVRLVVHLVRDPRDVAVSNAHHNGCSLDDAIAFMNLPEAHLVGETPVDLYQVPQRLGTWSDHVASWLDAPPALAVMTLRYEDRLADPVGTLAAVAARAGLDADDAIIRAAVEATSFDRLAGLEQRDGFSERSRRAERFFRAGRAGGWREVLSPEQAVRIESDHGPLMRRLGYLS